MNAGTGGRFSAGVAGGVDDGGSTASVGPSLSNRGLAQTLHLWVVLTAKAFGRC